MSTRESELNQVRSAAASRAAGRTGARLAAFRVLVAEDNPVSQELVLNMLWNLGYPAEAVSNGIEALAVLEHIRYDLLFLDCQMPKLDGYETAQRIREGEFAEGARSRLPIVALTAYTRPEDRQRCLDAGMDDHLAKPVAQAELAGMLDKWLHGRAGAPAPQVFDRERSASDADPAAPALDAGTIEQIRTVDPSGDLLRELFEVYMRDTAERLDVINEATDVRDADAVRRAVHALQGASISLGAREMSSLAAKVGRGATEGQWATLGPIMDQLSSAFDRVCRAMQDLGARRLP